MGKNKKNYDDVNVINADRTAVEVAAAAERAIIHNAQQVSTEPVEQEHGSYTLTVRYKHTKYADEDTDFTTALVKELAEDEFRFVTDHFDVLSVEVTDDSKWAN